MATTDIIVRTDTTFKSKDLNNAVKSFDKFFSGINKNWRDACILMHRLADGKKYEEDGFKSIADFAVTIGIEKSTAHHMADAGMVYDSKNPTVAKFAEDAGYTKASKVASIVKEGKEEELAKAIEEGEIGASDTVDSISSWKADRAAKAKKEEVLPRFNIHGYYVSSKGEFEKIDLQETTIEDLTESYISGRNCDIKNLNVKNSDGKIVKKVTVALMDDGAMLSYAAEKVKKAKVTVKSVKKMTKAELLAALAALEGEEEEEEE